MATTKKTPAARVGNDMHYTVLPDRMPPLALHVVDERGPRRSMRGSAA